MPSDHPALYTFTVMRRHRGVWLADWSEDRDGNTDFDAFPTEAAAKRWCAEAVGRERLPWEAQNDPDATWYIAHIEVPR